MSLRTLVQRFTMLARANPISATDPGELKKLEAAAATGLEDGFVALTAPNAPFTWEVRTLLLNTAQSTNRVKFAFPWKTNLVGIYPHISIVRPIGALAIPTLDDIDVQVDINNQAYLTGLEGLSTAVGVGGNNSVTLASLGVQLPRLMALALVGESKPDLGFTFRWKQPPLAGPTAIYESVIVGVSLFANPRDTELGQNVGKGLVGT